MDDDSKVRQAARETVAEIAKRSVRDDECVVSTGLIDSLSVLKLVVILEGKLAMRIPKNRVQPEDFDSVDIIVETIDRVAQ